MNKKVINIILVLITLLLGINYTRIYNEKEEYINTLIKENENLKYEIVVLEGKLEDTLSSLSIEDKFKFAANAYGLDWKLVYAIARLETGNFTSGLFINGNNPGGMRTSDGWLSYRTQSEGIIEMTRLIKYSYWNKGLQTPEEIGKKYCPSTADDWAKKVRSIMKELN